VSSRTPLIVFVVALAVACGSRAETPGVRNTESQSAAGVVTRSPAPTASPTATPRPNPIAGPATYTSLAYAYRVDLPAGWRRSACQSSRDPSQVPGVETFTKASVAEESGTDTGPGQDVVVVQIEDNAGGQTALGWLESGKLGFSTGSTFEKITFDNNPDAARIVTTDSATTVAIVVNARFRMYAVTRGLREPTPATEAAARTIMTSLHILRDDELADARATLQTAPPSPARSAEQVADALARGFSQQDTAVIAAVSEECVQSASENAGGSFRATSVTLADMRIAFANGFVVTVQARPLVDQTVSNASVLATWKDAGQAQRNVKLMMTKVGNTWYWIGVLFLRA
jgi:hypothetical protein